MLQAGVDGHGTFGVLVVFAPANSYANWVGLSRVIHKETTASINSSNYFMYRWGGLCVLPLPLFTQVQATPASQSSQCIGLHQLPD